jgi:hypothetical protein
METYIMAIKLNPAKAQFVIDLLKSNSNRFTPAQLLTVTGNERRARSALSHARMAGIALEAVRDAGRTVTAYVANGAIPSLPAGVAKASRASSTKSAKTARVAATPKAKVDHSASNKLIAKTVKTKRVAKAKVVAAPVKSDEEIAAIKAKNLETMREVSQRNAKLEDRLTPEQRAIREEFYAEEEAIARMEERADLRNNAPAFLFKESYSE